MNDFYSVVLLITFGSICYLLGVFVTYLNFKNKNNHDLIKPNSVT
jgi:hypothetical protein